MVRKSLISVGQGHRLFCLDRGNPKDTSAVMFIHGGPGGSSQLSHFDWVPTRLRVVAFDQRGCGRSNPPRSLVDNSTQRTIEDIELIRIKLGINKLFLIGGSWGAALAMLYAASFPKQVEGMIIYSPFLGSDEEVQYYLTALQEAAPIGWEKFTRPCGSFLPLEIISYYYAETVLNSSGISQSKACQSWLEYEVCASTQGRETNLSRELLQAGIHLAYAPVSCSYFENRFFLEGESIMEISDQIFLPIQIVQGGVDLVSDPKTAQKLTRKMPNAKLHFAPNAGHCGGSEELDELLRKVISETLEKAGRHD